MLLNNVAKIFDLLARLSALQVEERPRFGVSVADKMVVPTVVVCSEMAFGKRPSDRRMYRVVTLYSYIVLV